MNVGALVASPQIPSPDSDILEFVDYLFGEDLGEFAFSGSDQAAKTHLIATDRLLLIRRNSREPTNLHVLLRVDPTEFKEFVYKVTPTSSDFQIQGPVLSKMMTHELTFSSGIDFINYLKAVARRGLDGLENEEVAMAIADLLDRPPKSSMPSPRSFPLVRVNSQNQLYVRQIQIKQISPSEYQISGPAGESATSGQFILQSLTAALNFLSCLKKSSPLKRRGLPSEYWPIRRS